MVLYTCITSGEYTLTCNVFLGCIVSLQRIGSQLTPELIPCLTSHTPPLVITSLLVEIWLSLITYHLRI